MSGGNTVGWGARNSARALTRLYYRHVEITGGECIPVRGPVLLCANHANSLFDPPLLGLAARRPVSFLAKAPLFEVPLFGAVLRALGMIPAYRGRDDARRENVARNLESLATAARRLAAGGAVGIFPEGLSHDLPQVQQVRTGAARLSLQAVELGARDLIIVPIGLNFEAKERFRSSVWINVGEPLPVAPFAEADSASEKRAMRDLTAELDRRLKACVIHLEETAWEPLLPEIAALLWDEDTRRTQPAAAIHLRHGIATAMNYFRSREPERTAALAQRLLAWRESVRAAGLDTSAPLLQLRGRWLAGRTARGLFYFATGLPFAALGLIHHLAPVAATRLVAQPFIAPGRTTIAMWRLLAGLPIYAAWYGIVWWVLAGQVSPVAASLWTALAPFFGLFALDYFRRARAEWPLWLAQARLLADRARLAALRAEQQELLAQLHALADDYSAQATAAAQKDSPPTHLMNVTTDTVLAVVDIGSNSIKILVAAPGASGGPEVRALFQETIETRISGGIGAEKSRLAEAGMANGIAAIAKLLDMAAPYSPTHRIVVATSAVRDARNRDDFSARVWNASGVPLEILSGGDEARIIARGIQTDPALRGAKDFCILDLGGGSLECIRYEGGEIRQAVSLQLGAVRLTEKLVRDPRGPFTVGERAAVAGETRRLFVESGFRFIPGGLVVGTGGAFTVCRAIFAHRRGFIEKKNWPAEISRADLAALLEEIAPLDAAARARIEKLTPERVDIMPAALATLATLLELAGAARVLHSFHNLRFGVAARFFAKLRGNG